MDLTPDQAVAMTEMLDAMEPGARHLLTGNAGTGKSHLLFEFARKVRAQKKSIVLTAPTHKAVAVLAKKVRAAGLEVECRTIQSLLSLRPRPDGEKLRFERAKYAKPVEQDVVVVDECSMNSTDLMVHIRRHLAGSFTLFSGDPAQLPPVGEVESEAFATRSRSHLSTIVRQAEGNPVLEAAHAIRRNQGGEADWSWCRPRSVKETGMGVYVPSDPEAWMRKAFTSDEFDADPDRFRFLAWTNRRVAEVNTKVRRWRYGSNIPTPFMPGERALFRAPLVRGESIVFANNEEATVKEIDRDEFAHPFAKCRYGDAWVAKLPAWRIAMARDDGEVIEVHMPADDAAFQAAITRCVDERRWEDLHEFKGAVAMLQSIYAQTVHTSQGSTLRFAFVDFANIRQRERTNLLEMWQLLYVAVTRPSHGLVLIGS